MLRLVVTAVCLISLFTLQTSANTFCSDKIGTCDYYSCLEEKNQCGNQGYYLNFGKYYCEKYSSQANYYSESGQTFLQNIRRCLQEKLEEVNQLPSCIDIKNMAIRTHKQCYTENNYCALPAGDKFRVKLTAVLEIFDADFVKFAKFLQGHCNN